MTAQMILRLIFVVVASIVLHGCAFDEHTLSFQPGTTAGSVAHSAFWSSVISTPCGETNAVYYAGSIDDIVILMHQTSAGVRKWNLKGANIDKNIIMQYTTNKNKWLLLKGTDDQHFRQWDWKKEIEDNIQNLTKNSALVKPVSTFYMVDGDIRRNNAWIVRVDEFVVKATLCDILKKGDKICTRQLYDGDMEDAQRIISEARSKNNPIVGRVSQDGGLCLAYWGQGKFIQFQELPTERFFIIDNEIVAPFEFLWDGRYDGLLEFDEQLAIDFYLRRVESEKRRKHE